MSWLLPWLSLLSNSSVLAEEFKASHVEREYNGLKQRARRMKTILEKEIPSTFFRNFVRSWKKSIQNPAGFVCERNCRVEEEVLGNIGWKELKEVAVGGQDDQRKKGESSSESV